MTRLNPCHSRQRPTPDSTYIVQDGYHETIDGFGNPVRSPKYVRIKVFSKHLNCMYDKSTVDLGCSGCPHVQSPAGAVQ